MKPSELLALENYLNCYDYQSDFDTNVAKVAIGDIDIDVLDLYKSMDKEKLASEIQILHENIRHHTNDVIIDLLFKIEKEREALQKQVNLAITYLMSLLDSADNVKHAPAIIKQMEAIKNG